MILSRPVPSKRHALALANTLAITLAITLAMTADQAHASLTDHDR
jgi:hypothetical protein